MKRDIAALDIRLLVAFDALVTELNVTRAAARTGVTQQGLSGQLARLRDFFGDPLFVRNGAGMAATPQAEALQPLIRDVLTRLNALAVTPAFTPAAFEGAYALAATDYAMALLLPPLLGRVRAAAPKLKLVVRHGTYATLDSDMRERKVDLALVAPQFTPPGLRSRKLFSETYAGAVRPDHPLAKRAMTLDRFCAFPHLLVSPNRGDFSGPTDEALAKLGRKRDVALVVPSFSVVAALLESTDLVAVLPTRLLARVRRPLFIFKTPVDVEGFELHAVWPDRLHADPMHRWFRSACFETATEISDGPRD